MCFAGAGALAEDPGPVPVPSASPASALPSATSQPLVPGGSPSPSASDIPAGPANATASAAPGASGSPAPSPKPKKPKRLNLQIESATSYINNQFVGPGIKPPEAALFAAGDPRAPGTPYDFFGSSPLVTGYGIVQALKISPVYTISPQYTASATLGYGSFSGNGNVAGYWGDQPLETVNPHLGMRAASIPVQFPTTNKSIKDVVSGTRASFTAASIGRKDGDLNARIGYFDLAQTESFVFTAPAQTNTPQWLGQPLPEGIGDAPPTTPLFVNARTRLPLHGIDIFGRPNRTTSVELTDAELPAMPGSHARMTQASVEVVRNSQTSYGIQVSHLTTGGIPTGTTVLFGNTPTITPSVQGPLPTSILGGQRMAVAGLRANFMVTPDIDAQVRYGYSCYGADQTAQSRVGCTPGNYLYGKLHRGFTAFDLGLELMRYEATYAPAQMPYGTLENVWSIAYSWPGTWLKGAFPYADTSLMGPNRQGYRLTSNFIVRGVETRLAYGKYDQIKTYDAANAFTPGFVEGYFLPQLGQTGTLGRESHAIASFIAHPKIKDKVFDAQLDFSDIAISRGNSAAFVPDGVKMDYPAYSIAISRQLNPKIFAVVGGGRYALKGAFNASGIINADLAERAIFAAVQFQQNATSGYSVKWTNYSVDGLSTVGPGGPSPAFHGPQVFVEQRFKT